MLNKPEYNKKGEAPVLIDINTGAKGNYYD